MRKIGKIVTIIVTTMILSLLIINVQVYAKTIAEATEKNPYKIVALGDSITYPVSYASYIDLLPNVSVDNQGVPGSQVAGPNAESYLNRAKKIKFYNADLVLIMGGTNDYCAYSTLAKDIGMYDSHDTNTFCGAYNDIIGRIKRSNKNAKIVLLTPTRGKGGASDYVNIYGYTLENYANAVKLIAMNNGVYCIDLYHEEDLDFTDPAKDNLLKDPIHPSLEGHKAISEKIIQYLTLFAL